MTKYSTRDGKNLDQLGEIVRKISDPGNKSRNKFELSLFDPERDVDDSPYGGQCLSFLSFKLSKQAKKRVNLTAIYRNHYYVGKLLGNLIGLANLLSYVSKEGGVSIGQLTVISTHAIIDLPGEVRRTDLSSLFDQLGTQAIPLSSRPQAL